MYLNSKLWQERLLFLSLTLGGAFLSGAAPATEANSSDTGNTSGNTASSSGPLEEIVVTATRREENISKVPISITAMSQDMFDQKTAGATPLLLPELRCNGGARGRPAGVLRRVERTAYARHA
jgi:outer membrane receptor protein involved in Fe transport